MHSITERDMLSETTSIAERATFSRRNFNNSFRMDEYGLVNSARQTLGNMGNSIEENFLNDSLRMEKITKKTS